MKPLTIIDGNAYVHRAYHALPPLTNSRGEPVGAVYGFARMLIKILQSRPERVIVCFDTAAPTFRHQAYKDYKAQRPEMEETLSFQFPLIKDLIRAWGIPTLEKDGYEADDLLATLSHMAMEWKIPVLIVTGDKDALQLVSSQVKVLNEPKNVLFDAQKVEEIWGVPPEKLLDVFSLMGDASDNIPGIPGIGLKTAVKLIQSYQSLEKVLQVPADLQESTRKKIEMHRDLAKKSLELIRLDHQVPLQINLSDLRIKPINKVAMSKILTRLEFSGLATSILNMKLVDKPDKSTNVRENSSLLHSSSPQKRTSPSRQVSIIQNAADLKKLASYLKESTRLSVDVETTGKNSFQCHLVGIALSNQPGEAYYIPIGHKTEPCLSIKDILTILKPILESPHIPKWGQNIKYDAEVLANVGISLAPYEFDTLLASYVLNPSRPSYGLKNLALEFLIEKMIPITELIGKGKKQVTMADVPIKIAAEYAGADAEVVLRLGDHLSKMLKEQNLWKLFSDVEMPLIEILQSMETHGITVDRHHLIRLEKEFLEEMNGLEKTIYLEAGMEFNLNSPKQLQFVLFEKLQLPKQRKIKTGYSTDEDVLKTLALSAPICAKLLSYRELSKLKSTYVDSLLLSGDKNNKIHTQFHQAGTATGRLSSSEPNLQNIPIRTSQGRKIRRAFIPQKDWCFLSADYSQIDLRVLAHVTEDPNLCTAFRNGHDIHATTAGEVFGIPIHDVSKEQRNIAKAVNFGIVYGQKAFGLSQTLGTSIQEAGEYIEKYLNRYAGVARWTKEIIEDSRKKGHVETLLGRKRYLPEILSSNTGIRSFAERVALNTPIQGSSADIIKLAMIQIYKMMKKGNFSARMLLQVHDDLLFETPKDEREDLAILIKYEMENAIKLKVPLIAELKTGPNWAEMKELKTEVSARK